MNNKFYPYLLVTLQFGCLIFIAISAPVVSNNIAGLLVESAGIFLAVHAIYIIKIKNANITPTVKLGSELITSGPYRIIRHPMYIAQLVAVLPLVIDYFTWYRFAAIIILLIVLLVKIEFEEKQLIAYFPKYAKYRETTSKMIPFIY